MFENLGRIRLATVLSGLALAAASLCQPAQAAQAAPRQLVVDASRSVGAVKPLGGVAGIPGPAPGPLLDKLPDLTGLWKAARVDYVRSFDWVSALDTVDNPNSLFPSWSADPDDPASYNFAASDAWVKESRSIGARVLFTVCYSIPGAMTPPADIAKYQKVVEHIVRHYTRGWANGMQDAIQDWEFGDEPDLGDLHFNGTPQQFYDTYAAFARAVKRVDPALRVGGPSLAFPLDADAPYRDGFLQAVRARGLPLDFFSWKWFTDGTRDPMDFSVIARDLRRLLDQQGFRSTDLVLAAWSSGGIPGVEQPTPVEAAALQTAAAIYMQDAPLARANLFRMDSDVDVHYGPLDPARIDGHWRPAAPFDAMRLTGQTLAGGRRVAATGGDDKGFAVLATSAQAAGDIHVLIANYAIPPHFLTPRESETYSFELPRSVRPKGEVLTYRQPPQRPGLASNGDGRFGLTIRGMRRRGVYVVSRYRVDDGRKGALISTDRLRGPVIRLKGDLPAPGVEMIELSLERAHVQP